MRLGGAAFAAIVDLDGLRRPAIMAWALFTFAFLP
jgi:hypothetical protein